MIVSGHSCCFQFARLQRSDFTERDTNFHTQLAHLANDLKHAVKFFRTRRARRATLRPCKSASRHANVRGSLRLKQFPWTRALRAPDPWNNERIACSKRNLRCIRRS